MYSEPVRTCVGCRRRHPVSALVRVTRGVGGITVDGPGRGRGAWLCRTPEGISAACVSSAVERRAFARAWRGPVSDAEYRAIEERAGTVGAQRAAAAVDVP